MNRVLIVFLSGGTGCVARYLVGIAVGRRPFPYATLIVNLVGSFLIALILELALGSGGPESKDHAFTVDTLLLHIRTVLAGLDRLEQHGYSFGQRALTLLALCLVPAGAWAQASLTGTVRDSSGAGLPGVLLSARITANLVNEALQSPASHASPQPAATLVS